MTTYTKFSARQCQDTIISHSISHSMNFRVIVAQQSTSCILQVYTLCLSHGHHSVAEKSNLSMLFIVSMIFHAHTVVWQTLTPLRVRILFLDQKHLPHPLDREILQLKYQAVLQHTKAHPQPFPSLIKLVKLPGSSQFGRVRPNGAHNYDLMLVQRYCQAVHK